MTLICFNGRWDFGTGWILRLNWYISTLHILRVAIMAWSLGPNVRLWPHLVVRHVLMVHVLLMLGVVMRCVWIWQWKGVAFIYWGITCNNLTCVTSLRWHRLAHAWNGSEDLWRRLGNFLSLLSLLVDCLLLGYQLLVVKLLLVHRELSHSGVLWDVLLSLSHLLLFLRHLVLYEKTLVLEVLRVLLSGLLRH